MRLVASKSLTPGDTLAVAVCGSSGNIILNAGVSLSEAYIEKLKQLNIDKVYINDGRFDDVEVIRHLDLSTRMTFNQVVRDSHDKLHKGKDVDEYAIKNIAKDIVEYVRDAKDKGVNLLSSDAVDDYITGHTLNVSLTTAYIGTRLSYNYSQLCDLVTGAVIHDLGRENIPEESPEHVQKGFEAMRKCRGLNLHSSIVCYEHHENFDGSGYPRRIKGTAISEYSRIIRAADIYDNVIHSYENRNTPMLPQQAYEYLLAIAGSVLDPEIVKLFRDTIIFFPNGCTVILSNGLKGVVIKQNSGSPHRPVVRVYNSVSVIGEIDLIKSLTLNVKEIAVV